MKDNGNASFALSVEMRNMDQVVETAQPTPSKPNAEYIRNFVSSIKVDRKRLSVGFYRLSSERQLVRYVYVTRKLMTSANFSMGKRIYLHHIQ